MPVRSSTDDIELWLVDLAAAAHALAAMEKETPRLSPEDESKLARITGDDARSERRAAHIALRILVERAFGAAWRRLPYAVSATGKPSLAGDAGGFSLSHVPGLALIGLARAGAIGVDVERLRALRMSDDRRLRIEQAAIAVADGAPLPDAPELRPLQAWARIEAVAKADGCGVGPLLTRLGVARTPAGQDATTAAEAFTVYDLAPGEGLAAAVAVPRGTPAPRLAGFPTGRDGIERLVNKLDC